jgi:APA family basic amino acid/polyamine antiporter
MKPALMAGQLGNPWLLLSVWVVAGIITLFGALSNAEVAAIFPETGGQYVFFQKMYGEGFAFMYGWAAFAVFNTAGNASIAYVFSQYANYFVELPRFNSTIEQSIYFHLPFVGTFYPLENSGVKLLTILLVCVLTGINYRSVVYGSRIQRFLTALKAIAIILLIGGILFSSHGRTEHFNISEALGHDNLWMAYMAALAGAFWAYDGWNNITFIAGEIKNPQHNIPRSLFWGLSFCIIVYTLVNLAYIYVIPVTDMKHSSFIASDAANRIWGVAGGALIAGMVMLSTLGTTNANILATARVTMAMGNNSRLFSFTGRVHPSFSTPGNALVLNAVWSILLICSGSFDMLTDMLVFVTWFFYGMSALGVFVLRRKLSEVARPYKVWGYPWITLIFTTFTAFFLVSTLVNDISRYQQGETEVINSVLGVFITAIGIPLYYLTVRKKQAKNQ